MEWERVNERTKNLMIGAIQCSLKNVDAVIFQNEEIGKREVAFEIYKRLASGKPISEARQYVINQVLAPNENKTPLEADADNE